MPADLLLHVTGKKIGSSSLFIYKVRRVIADGFLYTSFFYKFLVYEYTHSLPEYSIKYIKR